MVGYLRRQRGVGCAAGNVIERTVYEPHGATVGAGPSDAPGYTGHVSYSATGLSYMSAAVYGSAVRRISVG